jgi:DNA-directed RNA polymerase subunit beta
MIDADTGEGVVEAGKKLTPRCSQLTEKGVKSHQGDRRGPGRLLSGRGHRQPRKPVRSISRPATGIDEPRAARGDLIEAGYDEIKVLDIDHINVGAYIRNTLMADKNRKPPGSAVRYLPCDASG